MADITPDLKNENVLIDPEETKFDITEIIKNHIGNSVRLFQLQNKYSKMIYNKKYSDDVIDLLLQNSKKIDIIDIKVNCILGTTACIGLMMLIKLLKVKKIFFL